MKALITLTIIGISYIFTFSIYTSQITTLDGTNIALAQYQGKKMLLVNIASGSSLAAAQLPLLEKLYQTYRGSLVVIAFPSNDFGNELRTDAEILMLLQNTYHLTFPVSVKSNIAHSALGSLHPVYKWLQDQEENGNNGMKVGGDFEKYLISKDGTVIGIFSGTLSPMDTTITNAITQ